MEPNHKLDLESLLADLEHYRPPRQGWLWRKTAPGQRGPFSYREISADLDRSIGLPASRYFEDIDPQPDTVITTEIASGRFEDDIRRMRMAAWHGADHMMVIRTAGQSHFDGLLEGTPEGVGGVPITRKQLRATRKALDVIEDEVGRPINFHSYVSGVAGPEIAVLFSEEGVAGAHQDPQYNVLYRNINVFRSFVDAAAAKAIMAGSCMLQIDGAHNANATAREAWKVMPELLVQHAINCAFSCGIGMNPQQIALSTVPPTAPPAPCLSIDLPYAVALREFFDGFRFRAQMNTRYMESSTREATVTHVLNLLISRLTSADIQSTITPDEGRNVPWHHYNVQAVDTAKQALVGMDGLSDLVELKRQGYLGDRIREIKERAILFLEEILETGGYGAALERGFFVDSGFYPERAGDGIVRTMEGGISAGTIVQRDADYWAPVCHHYGYNTADSCDPIGGCTLCRPEKIQYIDELDAEDNAHQRLKKSRPYRSHWLRPEVQWAGDGVVVVNLFLPADSRTAKYAALAMAEKMGLADAEVIHSECMHPAEGTYLEVRGVWGGSIDSSELDLPEEKEPLSERTITEQVAGHGLKVVGATVGEDEHSVGLREILDIKHGGLEGFGIDCHYLGTSVPVEKVVDAAVEAGADAILISTIISHNDVHQWNMRKLHSLCQEKGVRDKFLLVAGGTQVTDEMAKANGMDAGFGRGTKGIDVASFLVETLFLQEQNSEN